MKRRGVRGNRKDHATGWDYSLRMVEGVIR